MTENEYDIKNNTANIRQIVDEITTTVDKKFPGELAKSFIAFYIVDKYHQEYLKRILKTKLPDHVKEWVDKEIDSYFEQFDKKNHPELHQEESVAKDMKLTPVENIVNENIVRIENIRYKAKIKREFTSFFDHCYKFKQGGIVVSEALHNEEKGLKGEWKFQKHGEDTLIIIPPEIIADKTILKNPEIMIFNIVYEELKKFSKIAKIRIDYRTLERNGKPIMSGMFGKNIKTNLPSHMIETNISSAEGDESKKLTPVE